MFYYREQELKRLKKVYTADKPAAIAVYGRRRTGKSELILESLRECSEIPSFYFLCGSSTYTGILKQFVSEFSAFLSIEESSVPEFASFRQAIAFFLSQLGGRRLILVIDEFPYLSRKSDDKEVAAEFNEIIEKEMRNSSLCLILCGSNVRFMNYAVSDASSPLHGRFQETILVKPFTYAETAALFPKLEPFEQLAVYGATGGVAEYVFNFRKYTSFREGVENLYLRQDGRLYREADDLLSFEFVDSSVCKSILSTISDQRKYPADIAKAIGISANSFYYYAAQLTSVGILDVYKTAFPAKKRDTSYYIKDPFFRFYYGFAASLRSRIALLKPDEVYDIAFTEEKLHTYLGHIYEEAVIKETLYRGAVKGDIPFMPEEILPWVGAAKNRNGEWGETEIDLCLYDKDHVILGECKAKNKKLSRDVYEDLLVKSSFVHCGNRDRRFLLASFLGFDNDVLTLKNEGVILVSGAEIL